MAPPRRSLQREGTGRNRWGYISEEYERKLAELTAAVRPLLPAEPTVHGYYHYDEYFIAAFLRARQCDVAKAKDMLLTAVRYRREHNLDTWVEDHPPDPRIFRYLPNGWVGTARNGAPLYVERTGYSRLPHVLGTALMPVAQDWEQFGTGARSGPDPVWDWHMWHQESAWRAIKRAGWQGMVFVLDMDGLSLTEFATRDMIGFFKRSAGVDEPNYPELLGAAFVVNANAAFVGVWNIIKNLYQQDIRDKVHILGADYAAALLEHVAPDQLPAFLNGSARAPDGDPSSPWHPVPAGGLSYLHTLPLHPHHVGLDQRVVVRPRAGAAAAVRVPGGGVLSWAWCTEGRGIGFEVRGPEGEVVVPPRTHAASECAARSVSGAAPAAGAGGVYTLRWHNDWLFTKAVRVRVEVDGVSCAEGAAAAGAYFAPGPAEAGPAPPPHVAAAAALGTSGLDWWARALRAGGAGRAATPGAARRCPRTANENAGGGGYGGDDDVPSEDLWTCAFTPTAAAPPADAAAGHRPRARAPGADPSPAGGCGDNTARSPASASPAYLVSPPACGVADTLPQLPPASVPAPFPPPPPPPRRAAAPQCCCAVC